MPRPHQAVLLLAQLHADRLSLTVSSAGCWWRGSIGRAVLQFDHVVACHGEVHRAEQMDGTALASLLERDAAERALASQDEDARTLVLRGAVVSLGHERHYAGLRPRV